MYEKKIKISDIKKIYIESWQGKKDKKVKGGLTYRFEPFELTILSRDGDNFKVSGSNFIGFDKITLTNSYGVTTLFSFWIDLQYDNGKWFTGLPVYKGKAREECHPDTIRTIFLYPMYGEESN